jgi:hypothetical protein
MRSTLLALGGQHDDRRRVAGAAQPPADGQAILAGQHQVEDDQVEVLACPQLVHLRRIADGLDLEALFAEIADQQVAQAAVVVDDEKALLSVVHGVKDNPAVVVGMRPMVTSFFSGEAGNRLLQSGRARPLAALPG